MNNTTTTKPLLNPGSGDNASCQTRNYFMAHAIYSEFYGLHKEPFNITPDPDFLFLGDRHEEALFNLLYGIKNSKGFMQLINRRIHCPSY